MLLSILFFLAAPPAYTVEATDNAPPETLAAEIRKLLSDKGLRVLDDKGDPLMEVWFQKSLASRGTIEQLRNGLTYEEIPTSTIIGAVRLLREQRDYRKQKLATGTYTLRLAIQPVSDDHFDTAPYPNFVLLCPAADDRKPGTLEQKALYELSEKAGDEHPAVMLLFPPAKDAADKPKLLDKGKGHWVLFVKVPATAAGMTGTLGIGLTVVGTTGGPAGR